jgi:hypothetical protein
MEGHMAEIYIAEQGEAQMVKRPLGVWILTIWDGVSAGLLPVIGILILFSSTEAQAVVRLSTLDLVWSVFLGVSILAAAVGAWRGNDVARKALIGLVTVHYGILAFNNFSLVLSGIVPEGEQPLVLGRAIRSLVWIGINVWYFLSKRPRAFYGRD